jgi:HK97 family phage prohead protease
MADKAISDIDFKPTESMANEAQKGLDWRKEFGRGGTNVGSTRASQLIKRENLSPRTVKRMHSYFSRHEVDKQGEGFSPGEKGYPSAGRIAWALWGGDPGQSWARKKAGQIDREEDKSMNKVFNLTSVFKAQSDDDGTVKIQGYASTNDTDRAGDVIEKDAWLQGGLENFKNNPILLFNHDYNTPIGKATGLEVTDRGLKIDGIISKSAGKIAEMVKEGILGAFSVGFRVKDADYIEETDGLRIKDAELFEVSVVSVPANQSAIFSVAKSFDTDEEYADWKKQFVNDPHVEIDQSDKDSSKGTANAVFGEGIMSDKDFNLEEFAKEVARKTAAEIQMKQAEDQAAAKAEAEKVAADVEVQKATEEAELEEKKAEVQAVVQGVTTGAERLISDLEQRVSKNQEDLGDVVEELRKEINEKSQEIQHIRESKRVFGGDRQNSDWQKAFEHDVNDAYILAKATGKGYETAFAKNVMQKVNAHSGVEVSSADFEQTVSSNIERDIQVELVLAPLFREIAMQSATQILPILPDAGYAEFTTNQAASGSSPHGNLESRGDTYGTPFGGNDLTERTLSTKKLISQSYLGNETEEDAIIPILPLIRESIIRSHARAVENMILVGNHADGTFGTGGAAPDGLIALAAADSDKTQSSAAFGAADGTAKLTAAALLAARKNMGKYGIRPSDVVYIVSVAEYHNLISDAAYADSSQVEGLATKLTGQVGQVYGSPVIVSDEFATAAVSKFYAVAVNTRNFVIPRLRGVTVESDYEVANQRRVLVASQRLGFTDIINGATDKWALQYKAS